MPTCCIADKIFKPKLTEAPPLERNYYSQRACSHKARSASVRCTTPEACTARLQELRVRDAAAILGLLVGAPRAALGDALTYTRANVQLARGGAVGEEAVIGSLPENSYGSVVY